MAAPFPASGLRIAFRLRKEGLQNATVCGGTGLYEFPEG